MSRRRLLGSIGGMGALGAATGLGTWATLRDEELFSGSMTAGALGVTLDCVDEGGCSTDEDGTVRFSLGGIEPGDGVGVESFTLSVDANPLRAWLRTNCPPPVDPLGDVVEVRLKYREMCEGAGNRLYPRDGREFVTLNAFRRELAEGSGSDDGEPGIRLDALLGGPCLSEGEELCLDLEYKLTEEAEDLETEIELEIFAEQCRHVPEDEVEWPFEPRDCPEFECVGCEPLGKLEVEDAGDDQVLMPGTYGFDELYGPFATDGTTYELDVRHVWNKAEDGGEETVCVEFALLADGAETLPMCQVDVSGGKPDSTGGGKPDSPGGASNTVEYEIDPPSTRTGGRLCTEDADDPDAPLSDRPAISNVVVYACTEDDDGGDGGDDGCTSCPTEDGEEGEPIDEATFRYDGPDDVEVTFEQQGAGEGNQGGEYSESFELDPTDSFTVDFADPPGRDYDVTVGDTPLSVPAQSDSDALHISCSQVFGVGLELVDDPEDTTYTLTVESATNRDGESLCEVSD